MITVLRELVQALLAASRDRWFEVALQLKMQWPGWVLKPRASLLVQSLQALLRQEVLPVSAPLLQDALRALVLLVVRPRLQVQEQVQQVCLQPRLDLLLASLSLQALVPARQEMRFVRE